MSTLTTDEIIKPDIDVPTSKCHWWSSRLHCFHLEKKYCDSIWMQRRCCWCSTREFCELVVAGHGEHIPDKSDQTMIWTPWKKLYPQSY